MDRWQAMRIFVEVVESGGFAAAAKVLHMSPPSVTRAVAKLEDLIGDTASGAYHALAETDAAGEGYVADCRRILGEIAEAEANAAVASPPCGVAHGTAPALFGASTCSPVILDFLDHYPAMQVNTVFVDPRDQLSTGPGCWRSALPRSRPPGRCAPDRLGPAGALRLAGLFRPLRRAGQPQRLARHRIIGREGLFGHSEWLFGRDNSIRVPISPRLICNTNDAVLSAAVAGWGLSRFQSYQVAPDVRAGRLKVVLADHEREPVPIHIVHAEGRMVSARVRAFVDFAAGRFRRHAGLGTEL